LHPLARFLAAFPNEIINLEEKWPEGKHKLHSAELILCLVKREFCDYLEISVENTFVVAVTDTINQLLEELPTLSL
jgi:hypothetical protein